MIPVPDKKSMKDGCAKKGVGRGTPEAVHRVLPKR